MALPPSFFVKNVDLWNSDRIQKGVDVIVEHGRVKQILATTAAGERPEDSIDGQGKVLMPVGLDLQTHLRVPGQSEKETAITGLRAALRGGYGAVLTMPNTKPVIDSPEVCALTMKEVADAERQTGTRAFLTAAMTVGQEGRDLVDMEALKKAGVKAFTDDGKGVAQDAAMERVFAAAEKAGLPLMQHAEVPGHGAELAPGPTQAKLGLKAYPESAEVDMVARDLHLLEKYPKAHYHLLHISAAESLRLVKEYKNKGLKVTAEVTPHHLYFSSDDIPEGNTDFKMNPPIRGVADREALIEALADGTIDCTSTDHAPHEKARKGKDFRAAAFGTTGLETALRVLIDLHKKGRLKATRIVEVFSTFPARFMGLEKEFGKIEVGFPFRAAWVDIDAPAKKVELADLESLSKNNCFLGTALPGRVLGVFNDSGLFRF